MKRVLALICVTVLLLTASGCGSSNDTLPGVSLSFQGTLDETSPVIAEAEIPAADPAGTVTPTHSTTFDDLAAVAAFSTVAKVFDDEKIVRSFSVYFFHIAPLEFEARLYVSSNDVSSRADSRPQLAQDATGFGRIIMTFDPSSGGRTNDPSITDSTDTTDVDLELIVPWNDSSAPQEVNVFMTSFSANTSPSMIETIKSQ